ncbi:MAG: hypothetical protein KBS56_05065 [Clostridiales bacterium]|nr:hypothetical protein [Candidatus Crickella equi]
MTLTILLIAAIIAFGAVSVNAASLTATAKINSSDGVVLRKSATTSSASIKVLADNTKITITKEIFKTKNSTAKEDKWYYVTVGKKKGYVRSDLVDTVKYSTSSKTTATEALNYRKGAGARMPVVDTFKKGASITRVLPAKASNDSATWYKIKLKVNSKTKYYYVCGSYLKSSSASNADTKTLNNTKYSHATSSDFTKMPKSIIKGQSCAIRGTVTCSKKITKARVGVKNSSGNWVSGVNTTIADVNSKTFDIQRADSAVKFGKLKAGNNYKFCVYIWANDSVHSVSSQKFNVISVDDAQGPEKIAKTAIALAWDETYYNSGQYAFNGGCATPAFVGAFGTAFPNAINGKYAGVGADCGVFVATVVRTSGYDTTIPYSLTSSSGNMFDYLAENTSKWIKISYSGLESELQSGDIVMYHKSGGGQHVLIYVKKNGVGYTCEAANTGTASTCKFGYTNPKYSKIFKLTDKTIEVYRAIK